MLKDAGSAWANVRVAAYMFSRIIYQYRSPFVIILISYHGCLILIYYYLLHYSTLIFISRIIQASFSWCFDEVTAGQSSRFHPISSYFKTGWISSQMSISTIILYQIFNYFILYQFLHHMIWIFWQDELKKQVGYKAQWGVWEIHNS